uniref:Uncharacterized protein n=1 Tax=Megaselia scalaris TaxID=36166 RepID=T1GLE5_MEGSC
MLNILQSKILAFRIQKFPHSKYSDLHMAKEKKIKEFPIWPHTSWSDLLPQKCYFMIYNSIQKQ